MSSCCRNITTDRVIQICQILRFGCDNSNSVYTSVSAGMGGVDFRMSVRRVGGLRESYFTFYTKNPSR